MKNAQEVVGNLSNSRRSYAEYAAELGIEPSGQPYEVVFNLEVAGEHYSIYCNEENCDMGDRFSDAFYKTGIDGYRFLEGIVEEWWDSNDDEDLVELFEERLRVIKCLQKGGFIDDMYHFLLIDKRTK